MTRSLFDWKLSLGRPETCFAWRAAAAHRAALQENLRPPRGFFSTVFIAPQIPPHIRARGLPRCRPGPLPAPQIEVARQAGLTRRVVDIGRTV